MVQNGTLASTRLADLKGRLVALRFTTMTGEMSTRPEGPKGPVVTGSFPQAQVIAFASDGSAPERLPAGIVFWTHLGNALVEANDWIVGVLQETVQAGDKTRSYYSLEPVDAELFTAAVRAAGL